MMTIVAGLYARRVARAIGSEEVEELSALVSRFDGDEVRKYVAGRAVFLKVDIGAYESAAEYVDPSGNACFIAGDPLLDDDATGNRLEQTRRIAEALRSTGPALLCKSTGTFCGCHYDAATERVTLFADRSGVRPMYYAILDDLVVFSSALRVLESFSKIDSTFDVRGVAEIACFGFPLSDRTAYENIRCIDGGAVVVASDASLVRETYFEWDRLTPEQLTAESSRKAWALFIAGVRRRLKGVGKTMAFLSGGLDSRAIVGALRECGVEVATLNFAPPDTQDQVFAAMLATSIGVSHEHVAPSSTDVGDSHRIELVKRWIRSTGRVGTAQDRMMWSGDGGSVGVGHVYLDERIVAIAREQGDAAAVDAFLEKNKLGLPARLFRDRFATEVVDLPKRGMLEELAAIRCEDRGKALYLFLMRNDQRRHLEQHFESIDLGRIEFHLPFFDGHFLEYLMRLPIDAQLNHRFYMDWIRSSSLPLTRSPWQAYPGHVPCDVAQPDGLKYQWGSEYFDHTVGHAVRIATALRAARLAVSKDFPVRLLSRPKLMYLAFSTRFRPRNDYSYAIKVAGIFARYWRATHRSEGQPEPVGPSRLSG